MKRVCLLALLLSALAGAANAQVVDTTVCDVLKNPASFNGKTVRIKGTVVADFDQFVINSGDCGKDVNGIWLAYPQGSKTKSGPVAMLELAPAHNFAGTAAPVTRPAVTLTRDKKFKQFDSLLSQAHDKSGSTCLGCGRYQVQATLVGRLDGVSDASIQRDSKGKITGLGGFGNLNAYPARLVIQSVADVTPKELDYSAVDAAIKKAQSGGSGQADGRGARGPGQGELFLDPIDTAQKLVGGMADSPIASQIKADLELLPKKKEQNGITISYGAMNEIEPQQSSAATDSPDGVLYNCVMNRDRLPGLAVSMAAMHLAQHVADVRTPRPGNENAPLYYLENNAWAVSATIAVSAGEKYFTLPGGYIMWNAAWPDADKLNNMVAALNDFLIKQEELTK